jgi:hypothetical protein
VLYPKVVNYKKNSLNKKNFPYKRIILGASIIILAVSAMLLMEKTGVTDFFHKETTGSNKTDKTTSTVPSAQEDYSDGDEREPGNTVGDNEGSAGVSDSGGNTSADTDPSKWTASKTGEITVHTPIQNQSLVNNATLSGTSSLQKVSYRIIDNVSGVIGTGQLNVVNGKFSGNISFTTNATEGRLDIFGTRADESEFSNVEISIKFGK